MQLDAIFPNLAADGHRVTSESTNKYNCIAWAIGITDQWLWPDDDARSTWPADLPKEETIDAFVSLFIRYGFDVCESVEMEVGFEKIVLYTLQQIPQHAARLLDSGRWTSKLGRYIDIEHSLRGLEGDFYGSATHFMKRPVKVA
jgi:hypothetical protein